MLLSDQTGDNSHTAEPLRALLVEFDSAGALLTAAEQVRDAGYRRWDSHTPFPVHGMDDAMGIKGTQLPFIVLGGGLTGLTLATLMQWWMNAVDYPFMISGKPLFGIPANVPVMFELTVLFSAFAAQVAQLEARGASRDELAELLGQGRARRGMLEGELEEGELEIGQVSGLIDDIPTVAEVVARLESGYDETMRRLGAM